MPTLVVIAQAAETTNPILPDGNEAVWGVVSALFLVAVIVAVVLAARYLRQLRQSANAAAVGAAAAQNEVRALRAELREK